MINEELPQVEETVEKSGTGRAITLGIWLVVLCVVALIGWGLLNNSGTRPLAGDPAPDFTLHFYDGYEWQESNNPQDVQLSDMRGRVVVINFWASWCPPCHDEAADLERLWQTYKDDGVIFLGVAYIDTEPNALGFLEQYNISYPNGPDLQSLITDAYLVRQVPETFVVDQEGQVAFVEPGPIVVERLTAVLDELTAP